MTPAMRTALGAPHVRLTGLIRITLPSHVIRLCDGSISLAWGAETFTGRDPLYGAIGEVEAVTEATGDTIPGMQMSLMPPSLAAAVALVNPVHEGAEVLMWLACYTDQGAIVPTPDLQFAGEIDTMTLVQDGGLLSVQMDIASAFERMLEPDEGARLSDSFHQGIWPGEMGFANMTSTPLIELWGPGDKPPAAAAVPQVSRGGANRFF